MKERSLTLRNERPLRRLAFLIPLTPWPAILWIHSFHSHTGGWHGGAGTLYHVGTLALISGDVATLVGFVLLFASRDLRASTIATWVVFAILNGWTLWTFIGANSWAYA